MKTSRPSIITLWGMMILITAAAFTQEIKPWPWESQDVDVSILIFGDINIQDRENPADALRYLLPTFLAADFRIGNLEGIFSGTSRDPRSPDIPHKPGWKHSEPEMVKGLVDARIDAVSVANNVTWPWTALMKSLRVLDENQIRYAGGGDNIVSAHKPVILTKNRTRIGFLAYACTVFPFQHAATSDTPGIASVRIDTSYKPPRNLDKPGTPPEIVTIPVFSELERMKEDVSNLKGLVDVVICSYHWGRSDYVELIDYQIAIAHAAVDAGADVIMGHGNHELGPIELYQQRPIFYGLANLAFDWPKMKAHKEGMLVKIDVCAGKLCGVSVVPVQRDDENYPRIHDPNFGIGAQLYEILKFRSDGLASLVVKDSEIVVDMDSNL